MALVVAGSAPESNSQAFSVGAATISKKFF